MLSIDQTAPIRVELGLSLRVCALLATRIAALPEDPAEVELLSVLLEVMAPGENHAAPRASSLYDVHCTLRGNRRARPSGASGVWR